MCEMLVHRSEAGLLFAPLLFRPRYSEEQDPPVYSELKNRNFCFQFAGFSDKHSEAWKMTLMTLFGYTLIAFGPALALFTITVARDAQQVIVLISSAFFWLVSLLLSSTWWTIVSPLKDHLAFGVAFSVIFQELFRLAFWKLLKKAEEGLLTITQNNSPLRKYRFHYVAGLGFGCMSGLFAMVNVLADITGPGTIGLYGDHQHFVLITAFLTNCLILLNTFWGILFFDGMERGKWINIVAVVGSHLLVSLMTLLNSKGIFAAPLAVGYITLTCMAFWAFRVVGGSFQNLKESLFSRPE